MTDLTATLLDALRSQEESIAACEANVLAQARLVVVASGGDLPGSDEEEDALYEALSALQLAMYDLDAAKEGVWWK